MTSQALQTFQHAIQDAVDLCDHFDKLNTHPPPPEIEVLKRASLMMAFTALETYFEDRLMEAVAAVVKGAGGDSPLASFYEKSLEDDLKSFNTPNTERVRFLFKKYVGVDVTQGWSWNHCDAPTARRRLNQLVKKRGEITHRSSRPVRNGAPPAPHAITRDELRRAIYFVQQLAQTTDAVLQEDLVLGNAHS